MSSSANHKRYHKFWAKLRGGAEYTASGRRVQHMAPDSVAETRDERKYANVNQEDFCGTAAGRNPDSYPINTPARFKAAKAYARFAKNRAGLIRCAEASARRHIASHNLSESEKAEWAHELALTEAEN